MWATSPAVSVQFIDLFFHGSHLVFCCEILVSLKVTDFLLCLLQV